MSELLRRTPGKRPKESVDAKRATAAVVDAGAEILVVFALAEVRQDLTVAPACTITATRTKTIGLIRCLLQIAPPQAIVLNLRGDNGHRSVTSPLFRYERINVLHNLGDDLAYRRRSGARMGDRAEQFDHWIRTAFVQMNTELENLYFARERRAQVIGIGDPIKAALRDEGRVHVIDLRDEGNTGDGF